ncbi:DEAD-boc ATP-dependent (RNA) helicase [Strigomonas culicis]|nr:ATP-dependent RNA helicase DeaD [Strigomonas culicis]EPY29064.1 DEAD-boc ATP-dependent (RNA) helicase [Strigomonas culicis]|eukprot:EPY20759.1 ATP-dependent RNA helicase DeaD [Strigomonas culicis]
MWRRSGWQLLQYLRGVRAPPRGSAASLLEEYQDNASGRISAIKPVSQRYFYQSKEADGTLSQRHRLLQMRLGDAQLLASTEQRFLLNHNEAHPLYYAQTSPREAGLCVPLVLALKRLRIKKLTELQGALIPLMLKGQHVIAHSETGTGKSFGIALAIANRILRDSLNYRLHTVVLVPTEELALQYDKWFRHFGGCTSQIVQAAIERIPLEAQLARLHNIQPHVLVGTPQRIADIVRLSPSIVGEKLRRKVDCVVLDEADLLLSAEVLYGRQRVSGANLVDRLFRSKRDEVPAQLVAASATVDGVTAQTLNAWTRNDRAVRLTTSFVEHALPSTISFYFFAASQSYPLLRGLELLLRLICRQCAAPRVLLFTEGAEVGAVCRALQGMLPRLPEAAPHLAQGRQLAEPLHAPTAGGGAVPAVRPHQIVAQDGNVYVRDKSALALLNEGRLLVGVGSHEVSRGLHVGGVTHVVLLGPVPTAAHFVHCAGRTGRMGAEGDVIVLYPPSAGRALQTVCRALELPFAAGRLERVEQLLQATDFGSAEALTTVKRENDTLEEEIRRRQLNYLREGGSV